MPHEATVCAVRVSTDVYASFRLPVCRQRRGERGGSGRVVTDDVDVTGAVVLTRLETRVEARRPDVRLVHCQTAATLSMMRTKT